MHDPPRTVLSNGVNREPFEISRFVCPTIRMPRFRMIGAEHSTVVVNRLWIGFVYRYHYYCRTSVFGADYIYISDVIPVNRVCEWIHVLDPCHTIHTNECIIAHAIEFLHAACKTIWRSTPNRSILHTACKTVIQVSTKSSLSRPGRLSLSLDGASRPLKRLFLFDTRYEYSCTFYT